MRLFLHWFESFCPLFALIFSLAYISVVAGQNADEIAIVQLAPATGKYNQFVGFYTPRPLPDDNGVYTFSSLWASWSAWSFCSEGLQVRVRACNTIRGFSCLGPNREERPCPESFQRKGHRFRVKPTSFRDYEANDPWEDDRNEALKQLAVQEENSDQKSERKPLEGPFVQSAGKTLLGLSPPGRTMYETPGKAVPHPPDHPSALKTNQDGSPSMTPELLFGSKVETPEKIEPPTENKIASSSEESHSSSKSGSSSELLNVAASVKLPSSTESPTTNTKENEALVDFSENKSTPSMPISTTISAEKGKQDKKQFINSLKDKKEELAGPIHGHFQINGDTKRQESTFGVDFPSEKKDQKGQKTSISDTRRAFEWMINEMEKKGKEFNSQILHSGEAIIPAKKSHEESLGKKARAFSIRSQRVEISGDSQQPSIQIKIGNDNNENSLHSLANNNGGNRNVTSVKRIIQVADRDLEQLRQEMLKMEAELEQIRNFEEGNVSNKTSEATISPEALKYGRFLPKNEAKNSSSMRENINETNSESDEQANGRRMLALNIKTIRNSSESTNGENNSEKRTSSSPSSSIMPKKDGKKNLLVDQRRDEKMQQMNTLFLNALLTGSSIPTDEGEWSQWSEWGHCICGKQIRNRACQYNEEIPSKGCKGKSYQTRPCDIFNETQCPAQRKTTKEPEQGSTQNFYTLTPKRGNNTFLSEFEPRPLSVAHSLS